MDRPGEFLPAAQSDYTAASPRTSWAQRCHARWTGFLSQSVAPQRFPKLSTLLKSGAIGVYAFGMAVAGLCLWGAQDLPSMDKLWESNRPISIRVLDRFGREAMVRGAAETVPVDVIELPQHAYYAVLAVEDRRFFDHMGIDPIGLARAAVSNFKAGNVVEGGSTLTQQLAKNALLTPDRTMKRKIQEALLAMQLEREYSKSEILQLYLNKVYFGSGAYGLDSAARRYFGKPATDISIAEAAMLAGLLKAPSKLNPITNPDLAAERTARVLSKMADYGFISDDEHAEALRTPLEVKPPVSVASVNYFIDYIWPEVEHYVGQDPETLKSDLIIQTTLDLDAQIAAEQAVLTHLDLERGASEAALVALDGTGGVRAMIGGRNYGQSQFNRATQARRQPGSAFKPFVFLSALKQGISPWDMSIDEAVTIGDWEPRNFKPDYKGEISVQDAFAYSINTVAVTLSEGAGRDAVVETAAQFGLDNLRPLRSIALGAQGVSPIDLTAAYAPFANFGYYTESYGIEGIYGGDDRVYYERPPVTNRPRILDGKNLGQMNLLMQTVVKRGSGRAAQIKGRDTAGKTGTTNEFRDAWFVGYAPDYVAGVWVGNDDNNPMNKVTGGSIPAQIWKDFMTTTLKDRPKEPLPTAYAPARPAAKPKTLDLDNLLDRAQVALSKTP